MATQTPRRPTVLLMTPHSLSPDAPARDARFSRHIEALAGYFDLVTCAPGPGGGVAGTHIELPGDSRLVARTPGALSALALRRYRSLYRRSPIATAVLKEFQTSAPQFDIIVCSDLEMLPVAELVCRDRPIIVDLREYYPTQFDNDWKWRLMLKPLMLHLARKDLPRCAAALTVSHGLAGLYEENFSVRPAVVTNASPCRAPQPSATGRVIRAIHSGAATPSRQIEVMVEAAAGLDNVTLDLVLYSAPHLLAYRHRLESLAARTPNVRVLSAVPGEELPAVHSNYDVGLACFPNRNPQLNHALPNKLFDYIQSGLAVVGGPGEDIGQIVDAHRVGPVLDVFSVERLRRTLASLTPGEVDAYKVNTCSAAPTMGAEPQADRLRAAVSSQLR